MSSFQCSLCNVIFTSQITKEQHILGKRHQKAEKNHQMLSSCKNQGTKLNESSYMASVNAENDSLPFIVSTTGTMPSNVTSVNGNSNEHSISDVSTSCKTNVITDSLTLTIPSEITPTSKFLKDAKILQDSNGTPQFTHAESKMSETDIQISTVLENFTISSQPQASSCSPLTENENQKSTIPNTSDSIFFCSVCEISCTGENNFIQHLKGSKHSKKTNTPSSDNFFCNICLIACTGSAPYQQHLKSLKHIKKTGSEPSFCQTSSGTHNCDLRSFSCHNQNLEANFPNDTHAKAMSSTADILKTSISTDLVDNLSSVNEKETCGEANKSSLDHCNGMFNTPTSDEVLPSASLNIKPFNVDLICKSNDEKLIESGFVLIKSHEDFAI